MNSLLQGNLPTLDEHNRQVELAEAAKAQKAGVTCPICRVEMVVDTHAVINLSAGVGVKCPSCGYFGIKRQ